GATRPMSLLRGWGAARGPTYAVAPGGRPPSYIITGGVRMRSGQAAARTEKSSKSWTRRLTLARYRVRAEGEDMATGLTRVLKHLQQAGGGPSDKHLLARFVAARDEAAFAALVRRHGPMVLGACQRVLHDLHDAEDALQATFLVLARKAASL